MIRSSLYRRRSARRGRRSPPSRVWTHEHSFHDPHPLGSLVVSAVVVELTVATAAIHFSLGAETMLLNAAGYLFFGGLYAAAALAQVAAFRTVALIALGAYTAVTVGGYLVIGPHFPLGWATKAIEIALIGLLVAEHLFARSARGVIRRSPAPAAGRG